MLDLDLLILFPQDWKGKLEKLMNLCSQNQVEKPGQLWQGWSSSIRSEWNRGVNLPNHFDHQDNDDWPIRLVIDIQHKDGHNRCDHPHYR